MYVPKVEIEKTDIPPLSREEVLKELSWAILECKRCYQKPKFRQDEDLRISRLKLMIYSCNILAGILKDNDLEEMNKKIVALEEAKK